MKQANRSDSRSRWKNSAWPLVAAGVVVTLVLGQKASTGEVDTRTTSPSSVETANRDVPLQPSFEQIEAEAIEFVQEHHPELVSLLQLLKAMREKEYETAIRDIDRARKRLEGLEKREPETYSIELDSWKLQSKIDLLLAKGYAQDKAFDKKLLRRLLKDQVEVQKRRLMNELMNIGKRQEQLTEQLQKLDGHEDERIEQQFATLMKRVDAKAGKTNKSKPETKPAKEAKGKP